MGVIKKQGIQASGIAYIGAALGAVNTLWLFPNYLKPEEIGLITLMTSISLIVAPLAQLGVNAVMLKYYPYIKGDEEKEPSFIFFLMLIPTAGFILAMLILLLCKNYFISTFSANSPLFVDFLYMLIPFAFLFSFRNIADTFARTLFKVAVPRFYKEVLLRVFIIIVTLLYFYLEWSLTTFIYAYALALLLNIILLVVYIARIYPFKVRLSLKPLGKNFMRKSLIYGMFIILSGFANTIVLKIDGWMISSNVDLARTGIYSIAMFIGLAIEIPKRSINLISLPIVAREIKNNNIQEVEKLYRTSSLVQLIIGCMLFICIWINIDALFQLIPNGEIFLEGKYVVLFIGLGVLFDMSTGINNEIIYISDFYKYHPLLVVFLIGISIMNNLLLIPIFGITGAAMATAISLLIFNLSKYVLIWVKMGIQPFTMKSVKAFLLAAIVLIITMNLPQTDIAIVDIIYRSIIAITLLILPIYYLKLSKDIVKLIDQVIDRIKKILT